MQNRQLSVNWFNINVPTILAVAGATIGIIKYIDNIDNRSAANTVAIQTQSDAITDLKIKLEPLTGIPFRVLNSEGAIDQLNKRVDRMSETVISAFEIIRKDLGGIATRVEVQSTKIDNLTDKVGELNARPKPTAFQK